MAGAAKTKLLAAAAALALLLLAALAAPPLSSSAACRRRAAAAAERFFNAPGLPRAAQELLCSPWGRGGNGGGGGGVCDTADANVGGRLYFGDPTHTPSPSAGNNSDPYYLEKVVAGPNQSSLRLTINDDSDESLQIWGDSCNQGDCAGPGAMRHAFWANGDAAHTGAVRAGTVLCAGGECLSKEDIRAVQALRRQ